MGQPAADPVPSVTSGLMAHRTDSLPGERCWTGNRPSASDAALSHREVNSAGRGGRTSSSPGRGQPIGDNRVSWAHVIDPASDCEEHSPHGKTEGVQQFLERQE